MIRSSEKKIKIGFCTKIYLSYFLIICLLVVVFFIINYTHTRQTISENIRSTLESSTQLVANNLDQCFTDVLYANTQFYLNEQLRSVNLLINNDKRKNADDILQYFSLKRDFDYLLQAYNEYSLRVYLHDNVIFSGDKKIFFPISEVEDNEWFNNSDLNKGRILWNYSPSDSNREVACIRKLWHNDIVYVIYSAIPVSLIKSQLKNPFAAYGGVTLLYDGNNFILSDNSFDVSPTFIDKLLSDNNYIYCSSNLSYGNWRIYSIVPSEYASENMSLAIRKDLLIISIIFILSVLLAFILGSFFSKRIHQLVFHMENIEKDDFSNYIEITADDEIGLAEQKYNEMCFRIHNLIEQVSISNHAKRKAEIRAMQAQINPHFLYNTLDAINWKAIEKGQLDISDMVSSLGNFYRLSLSKGADIITIKEEIEIAKEYAKLQKMRNMESIDFEFNCSPECLDCPCVKLLIQPIIENAIKHGKFSDSTKNLLIQIDVSLINENRIQMIVGNNGRLLGDCSSDLPDTKTGYGLLNVTERIKLNFGEDSLVEIRDKDDSSGVEVLMEWNISNNSVGSL